jgi:hypothetical protein
MTVSFASPRSKGKDSNGEKGFSIGQKSSALTTVPNSEKINKASAANKNNLRDFFFRPHFESLISITRFPGIPQAFSNSVEHKLFHRLFQEKG